MSKCFKLSLKKRNQRLGLYSEGSKKACFKRDCREPRHARKGVGGSRHHAQIPHLPPSLSLSLSLRLSLLLPPFLPHALSNRCPITDHYSEHKPQKKRKKEKKAKKTPLCAFVPYKSQNLDPQNAPFSPSRTGPAAI